MKVPKSHANRSISYQKCRGSVVFVVVPRKVLKNCCLHQWRIEYMIKREIPLLSLYRIYRACMSARRTFPAVFTRHGCGSRGFLIATISNRRHFAAIFRARFVTRLLPRGITAAQLRGHALHVTIA